MNVPLEGMEALSYWPRAMPSFAEIARPRIILRSSPLVCLAKRNTSTATPETGRVRLSLIWMEKSVRPGAGGALEPDAVEVPEPDCARKVNSNAMHSAG